jgi:methionine biosynthesis protein MetW
MNKIKNTTLRPDLQAIVSLVREGSNVIDIGCGDGTLLEFLRDEKNVKGRGIEIDPKNVNIAVSKGIAAVHGDADNDLKNYPTNAVDYAILSQTIQATKSPKTVLREMMRVAKYGIVSIPNFGYWKNRLYLATKGKMPVTKTLDYTWHETPNIHFCTIKDFVILCDELGFKIDRQCYTSTTVNAAYKLNSIGFANLFAEFGVFLISKGIEIPRNQKATKNNSSEMANAVFAKDLVEN